MADDWNDFLKQVRKENEANIEWCKQREIQENDEISCNGDACSINIH